MLTNISALRSPKPEPNSGALEMLEGCHARIRHFLQLSRKLAENPGASPAEIAEASSAVFRYFNQALPLHEADENETLFPRLRDASIAAPLREAANSMVEEHRAIDELVGELLHFCELIQRNPELLPKVAEQFLHVTAALEQMFESHLRVEETVIFPALATFPSSEVEAMTREMQQRRRPPENIQLVR